MTHTDHTSDDPGLQEGRPESRRHIRRAIFAVTSLNPRLPCANGTLMPMVRFMIGMPRSSSTQGPLDLLQRQVYVNITLSKQIDSRFEPYRTTTKKTGNVGHSQA